FRWIYKRPGWTAFQFLHIRYTVPKGWEPFTSTPRLTGGRSSREPRRRKDSGQVPPMYLVLRLLWQRPKTWLNKWMPNTNESPGFGTILLKNYRSYHLKLRWRETWIIICLTL